MRKWLLRLLPLLGGLVALLVWREARSIDFVVAHIECPATIQSTETFPEKIGADPPFHPLVGVNTRSIHLTYSEPAISHHGQWVNCVYKKRESAKAYPAEFGYQVHRKIHSCEQKGPRVLECRVER